MVNHSFSPDRVLTAELQLPQTKYGKNFQIIEFYRQLEERISRLPGVNSVGAINVLPLSGGYSSATIAMDGPPRPRGIAHFQANFRAVSPGYFQAMGIPLIEGRYFTEEDNAAGPKAVIINEDCARRFWPGENPIGKRINLMSDFHANKPWAAIVGVGQTKDSG